MTSIDDREAREMLDPLAGEPGGTQRLDLDLIVREGDRRRRARSATAGAFTAVFLTAVAAGTAAIVVDGRQGDGLPAAGRGSPSAAVAPYLPSAVTGPDCTMSALPGPTGLLAAVDHTGRYTLEEAPAADETTVTVRKDGVQVAEVEIPAPGRGEYALNARGDFTVMLVDGSTNRLIYRSYVYADGKLTTLKAGGVATAINDSGQVAGTTKDSEPAIWERPGAAPAKLAVPQGKRAQVMFLDQDGTILGYANSEGSEFANLWLPDGSSEAVPVSDGQRPPTVWGIAGGWVAGFDALQGFRYNVATKAYEVLPAQLRRPHAVAANGVVVGDDGTDGNLYLLDGGTVRKLPVTPSMQHYRILGISDDGRTVTANEYLPTGPGDSTSEAGQAVIWTCA